jgi:hypothetical protein
VRTALGTTRADILSLVVRQGMTLTVLGVAIGVSVATQMLAVMSSSDMPDFSSSEFHPAGHPTDARSRCHHVPLVR